MTPLDDDEARDLIRKVSIDCTHILLDMRDAGASPADMMAALTKVNAAVMSYVVVTASSDPNGAATIRLMAKCLHEIMPATIAQYRAVLQAGEPL